MVLARRGGSHVLIRVGRAALEPDFSAADRPPDGAEDPQDDADHTRIPPMVYRIDMPAK